MIYIDNAATSYPKPEGVYNEMIECMKNYAANPGRSSHDMAIRASSKIIEARERLTRLFNIGSPFNIIFTLNATHALNIGIRGVLKKGSHVISTVIEHNSVLRPLNYMSRNGVLVTLVGVDINGYVDIDSIKNEIRENTRLIVVNHASNVLGTIQNIREIGRLARENNIVFMVDASQSAGIVPIDVEKDNIDMLAFPGHKGLLGPQGTGGLYIRDGIEVEPFLCGGTGSNSDSMKQPDFMPDKFESGTLNTPGIAGLCEGLRFIEETGIENILRHETELTDYLLRELKKMEFIKIYGPLDANNRTAVISFNIDGIDCSEVGYLLNKKGIAVRTGYHCAPIIHSIIGTNNAGTVRLSPGYFNTFDDIEKVIEAILEIYNFQTSIID